MNATRPTVSDYEASVAHSDYLFNADCSNDGLEVMSKMLKYDLIDSSISTYDVFMTFIKLNDSSMITKILNALGHIFNPSHDNNFAIRYASEHGFTNIVKILLVSPHVDIADSMSNVLKAEVDDEHADIV
jgi:hypothetical protein